MAGLIVAVLNMSQVGVFQAVSPKWQAFTTYDIWKSNKPHRHVEWRTQLTLLITLLVISRDSSYNC